MKRFLGLLLIITMAITPAGCISSGGGGGGSSDSGGGSAAPDTSTVTLVFNFAEMLAMNNTAQDIMLAKLIDFITMAKTCYAAHLYDLMTSLYIKVTGSGMSDIMREIEITDPSSTFSITLTVPNGPERNFEIKLKDSNNFVLYSGDLDIDVGNGGASQDITIKVYTDGPIEAEDYVEIGRERLESSELELAFIAFDIAVGLDEDHPVANFFRGFTKLLLLVQKDSSDEYTPSPNADITDMLNLYTGLSDIYSDTIVPIPDPDDPNKNLFPYNITPDIYDNDEPGPDVDGLEDEGYDDKLGNFFDKDWVEPSNVRTDEGVDVIKNVFLPEIDNVINNLAKAEADLEFSTTLTIDMHFGISSEIKVDIADIYVLEAIAYGLKAYYNHILAYQLRTEIDYWKDEFGRDRAGDSSAQEPYYEGLENILNGRPTGVGELDLAGDASSHLTAAKSAYLTGLDKLKAGFGVIGGRSADNKIAENHIFNVVDVDDSVLDVPPPQSPPDINKIDISKVTDNIDEAKDALNGAQDINFYDDYEDSKNEDYNIAKLNFSTLFDVDYAPDINSLPEFYYHTLSDQDLPIFDTNDPDPNFDPSFDGVIIEVNSRQIYNTADPRDAIVNALREEILPSEYKFIVPTMTVNMTGDIADFSGVWPVMLDEEEEEEEEEEEDGWRDLTDIYMTKDDNYLYIGMKFRGTPYNPDLQNDEWLTYHISFNAKYSRCDWYNAPVIVELNGTSEGWSFDLHSYGSYEPVIPSLIEEGCSYNASGNIVEFKIPLSKLVDWINTYQGEHFPDGWDGKEVFVAVSFWGRVSSEEGGDHIGDCLAGLNIDIGE